MASLLVKIVCLVLAATLAHAASARSPAQAKWDRSTPASSIRGIIAANRAGDREAIVASFAPAERTHIRQMVSNPTMLAANTAISRKIISSNVRRVRSYRGYSIVTVAERFRDGRTQLKNYPLKPTREGWLLTNELASDPNFQPFG